MNFIYLEKLIFWFMLYSITGWIYETALCSVSERKFINRGFLNGPYCPIYGVGAVLDVLILGRIQNVFFLFILGVIVTCTLEYLTSYVMEKLFHARWWDYSERKFNIAGRVCLQGAIVFGAFSVILIKLIHPLVIKLTEILPGRVLFVIVLIFSAGFLTDLIITVSGFAGFNKRLAAFSEALSEKAENAAEQVRNSATYAKLNTLYENFSKKMNRQQRRMISSFPKLRSVNHNSVLGEIRKTISKKVSK